MHHIVSDEWSNNIFFNELITLYKAFTIGETSPLSPLPIQYADFAVWQRQRLRGELLATELNYWKNSMQRYDAEGPYKFARLGTKHKTQREIKKTCLEGVLLSSKTDSPVGLRHTTSTHRT